MLKIIVYKTETSKEPFNDWFDELDEKTQYIISRRLTRIEAGLFGDCKPIKGYRGIYELVIDYGPGYRIYYGKQGSVIIILLIGGEKKSQARDIEKAHRYWIEYTEE